MLRFASWTSFGVQSMWSQPRDLALDEATGSLGTIFGARIGRDASNDKDLSRLALALARVVELQARS
jgi:hypothetical protein